MIKFEETILAPGTAAGWPLDLLSPLKEGSRKCLVYDGEPIVVTPKTDYIRIPMFEIKKHGLTPESSMIALDFYKEILRLTMSHYMIMNNLKAYTFDKLGIVGSGLFLTRDFGIPIPTVKDGKIDQWISLDEVGLLVILED